MVSNRRVVITGVAVAVVLAGFASPFASSSPDGLERVAADTGIPAAGTATWQHAAMPDYRPPGIDHEGTATGVAGVIGTVVVLVLALALGRLIVRRPTAAP